MRLPSKVTPYKKSIFYVMPDIIRTLEENDMSPIDLYKQIRHRDLSLSDYIEALDCLFILGCIEINLNREVIHYVKETTM